MRFIKMHGLGNDFVMVDARAVNHNWQKLSRKICDRHFGVGADGLILLEPPTQGGDVRMRIYNSDGSLAKMCGNGIRCLARMADELGLAKGKLLSVETDSGMRYPELIKNGGVVAQVRVDMGEPEFLPARVPFLGKADGPVREYPLAIGHELFPATVLSMGNPHCVIRVAALSDLDFDRVGPLLERHPLFPDRVNVEFTEVESRRELLVRVYERGAGATMACGTGACAAAVAASLNGWTERTVTVSLPGGDLLIDWSQNNHVYMTGPAEEVFSGEYPVEGE
jgi:diaminopimelate epimerase